MKKILFACLFFTHTVFGQLQQMPAYPLITHSPYFSVWSFADQLNSEETRHWTGKPQGLLGYITVDGKTYRFLGHPASGDTSRGDAMPATQQWVSVNATQTIYEFQCGGLNLKVNFTSPLLLNDLAILSRPVSYVSFRMQSNDGTAHTAQVYFGVSGRLAVNKPDQELVTAKGHAGKLLFLKAGTKEQPVLEKKGGSAGRPHFPFVVRQ